MNAAKGAPLMAAEGAFRSEGNIIGGTDEEQNKVLEDTAGSLLFGIPAVVGLDAVTEVAVPLAKAGFKKGTDYLGGVVESNPFLRKLGIGFEKGLEGKNPLAESGIKKMEAEQLDRSSGLMDQILEADKKLGIQVGASLEQAEKAGQILDIARPVQKAIKALDFSYQTFQDMNDNNRGRQIFERIANKMDGVVSPLEAKALIDDVDAFIGKFTATGNKTSTDVAILDSLHKVRKELSDQMKNEISGYREASQRFEEFRRLVPETIMSGQTPQDTSGIFMGKLRNAEGKLYKGIDDLHMNAMAQGSGSGDKRKAFINTERGVSEFMMNEINRGAQSPFDGKQFLDNIKKYSDEANYLKEVQTVKAPFVTSTNVVGALGQLGHLGAHAGATVAGRVARPVADISRKAYKLPAEKLNGLADRLESIPGLSTLGKALKDGLQNGDQAKKNAALFSILQNPQARILLDEDENEGN
jgi:hypothetical protein